MKFAITFSILLLSLMSGLAQSFTDFFCNPNAAAGCTNINAGSTATGTATYTSIATAAGGWNSAGTFTPDDGSTPASTVSAGMFASIYTNGVNTNATFIGRVTAVAAGVNGAITVSITAKAGTIPTTVAGSVAAISIKVGGTWRGPYQGGSTSVTFPFDFVGANMTNTAGSMVCVNLIGGTNYTVTNAITAAAAGPIRWEGYTNTVHDGGLATISGGTTVASFVLLTASSQRNDYLNLQFLNNGASGSSAGVVLSGSGNLMMRCIANGMRGSGFNPQALGILVECESVSNNLANTIAKGGFENAVASHVYLRCIAHDMTNINASGWHNTQAATLIDCIINNVGSNGITWATTGDPLVVINTDVNRARLSGIQLSSVPAVSQLVYFENSNLITNGTFGIDGAATAIYRRNGAMFNLGFGSGNKTNGSGGVSVNMSNVFSSGFVTYASGVTPWVSPDTGDFRINLAAAYGTGKGAFLQTGVGLTNNLAGFPSIGAVQPAGFTNTSAAAFAQ